MPTADGELKTQTLRKRYVHVLINDYYNIIHDISNITLCEEKTVLTKHLNNCQEQLIAEL